MDAAIHLYLLDVWTPRQVPAFLAAIGLCGENSLHIGANNVRIDQVEELSGAQPMTYQDQITVQTSGHRDIHDITDQVAQVVRASGVQTGIAHVFNVGSTGVIGAIEFEPGLKCDLPNILDKLIPPSRDYAHEQTWHDGNGHSHLQATWLGSDLTVPMSDGQLVLGTWQQIFHLECDVKPRQRQIVVTVIGE